MPLDTYAVSCCLRPYTSLVDEVGRTEAESLTGTKELGGSGTSTNAPRPGLGSDPAWGRAQRPYHDLMGRRTRSHSHDGKLPHGRWWRAALEECHIHMDTQ